jgi:flavin reductase (DIM6/NTAB) family NADH-FMN oxidoreductase RutF
MSAEGAVLTAEPTEVEFRKAMGCFATGVTVVTTAFDGEPHGMTLNSLTSVSLNPRLLLVCLAKGSRTTRAVLGRGAFVVNLLTEDQRELCQRFAKPGADRFRGLPCPLNDLRLPELPGTLGTICCTVENVQAAGDHYVTIGRVRRCALRDGAPLLFYGGRYGRCAPEAA